MLVASTSQSEQPVFTDCCTQCFEGLHVTGWTKHQGNIYKAPMDWTMGKYKNSIIHAPLAAQLRPHSISVAFLRPHRLGASAKKGFSGNTPYRHGS
jgi:hypothetical protein